MHEPMKNTAGLMKMSNTGQGKKYERLEGELHVHVLVCHNFSNSDIVQYITTDYLFLLLSFWYCLFGSQFNFL